MHWNYRLIRKHVNDEYVYNVYEAYYDDNGKISTISKDPIILGGCDIKEVMVDLINFMKAFTKPILNYDDIPEDGSANIFKNIVKDIEPENIHISFSHEFRDMFDKLDVNKIDKEIEEERINYENLYENNCVNNNVNNVFNWIMENIYE